MLTLVVDNTTKSADGEVFAVGDRVYNHIDKCGADIKAIASEGVVTLLYDDGIYCDTTVNYLTVTKATN